MLDIGTTERVVMRALDLEWPNDWPRPTVVRDPSGNFVGLKDRLAEMCLLWTGGQWRLRHSWTHLEEHSHSIHRLLGVWKQWRQWRADAGYDLDLVVCWGMAKAPTPEAVV